MADPGVELVGSFADFGRALREAGLSVGTGDLQTFSAAVAELDPADLMDLYWAGRTTLVTRHDQEPTYHDVFCEFFLGQEPPPGPLPPSPQQREDAWATLAMPETEPDRGSASEESAAVLGLVASDAATLKSKAFSACTEEELLALRRIMRHIRINPPRRTTRRTRRARDGRLPDLRRTVRETMRTHGEPARLYWRRRDRKRRPLTLILDVSGSMADYSRNLLQFAHITSRATTRVEVFCFGTRLTRITPELRHRGIDTAIDRAAKRVFDFDGGTRIGESLETFAGDFGRRGVARGGIVVICSDGLDRGSPVVLEQALKRLRRQCHRIVWLSPQAGAAHASLAMRVAEPYLDAVLPARDLASLEAFAHTLSEMR
ncbi:vWA domain-containing protein [Nocardioides sp.]|uniref:vWA domain-containing protein n=1 Tax=Nocardioides sp. TaxID=35761 RepID=UPI0039E3455C